MSDIVLFGGDGNEHRVSVASAQNIARYLTNASYWYWTREGSIAAIERDQLLGCERPFEQDFTPEAKREWPGLEPAFDALTARERVSTVVFLALHGGSGENGTVQEMLERRGLGFTGSSSRASRLAFDKLDSRELARKLGFRVAEGCLVEATTVARARLEKLLAESGRVVIKPVADGSSHGVQFIDDEPALSELLSTFVRDPTVPLLAEAFVSGRELTVGIIDDGAEPRALPCSEVRVVSGRTFDFAGKYLGEGTEEITPAPVSEEIAASVQSMAAAFHRAAGCDGYSRTDVILDGLGPVFLEINTLPGLTAASFIPQQLDAAGLSFEDFLRRQIERARARRTRSQPT